MSFADQADVSVRCEWGDHGLDSLAPAHVTIIVDVLSFSTAVDLAVSAGAEVLPFPMGEGDAEAYAREHNAHVASKRGEGTYSLSPNSLATIPAGTRLVLPSPNGSLLTFRSGDGIVIAGCLRNAAAVAAYALEHGRTVNVIPAGERWTADNTLRPSLEDIIGAGAVIDALAQSIGVTLSPEAEVARAAFVAVRNDLIETLFACSSGRELCERGFRDDVVLAAKLNASETVPLFKRPAYVRAAR